VLYNPVKKPVHALDLREKLGIGRDVLVLGRIGRPDDRGFDPIALRALQIIERGPARNILYLIQSPPPQMMKMAAELGLKSVRFLETPVVEDSDLSGFYNTIDVLAHARRDGETFGLNIAEAMMHGKPVISHRSRIANGHEEFVRKCGYFTGVDDYKGYADFIMRLYSDRALAARLGAAGRVFAEENFLFEKIGAALEGYYSELWRPRRGWREFFDF
jgi:glycosyltransferase involved in cell wall biosynthesis